MKRISTLFTIALSFFALNSMASDTLFFRFNDYIIKDATPLDTLIFDVEIRSSTSGTHLSMVQTDIIYNETVFGTNSVPVSITPLAMVGPGLYIAVGPSNPTTNSFRYGLTPLFPPYDPSVFSEVPTTSWGKLIRFKLLIQNNSQNLGMQFNTSAMVDQERYVIVPTSVMIKYVPIIASNSLLALPSTPTNLSLIISEVGDPSNSNADFVEVHNAGTSAVDFTQYPWFVTVYDGASYQNIALNGTLGAGETHVVGGNSYAAAYPGKTAEQTATFVEQNGTVSWYLTLWNPYNAGIFIDQYNGSAAPFTGKHAVRNYVVTSPNTVFTASEWGITPAANMDMTPGSHRAALIWDGSTGNVWADTANWTPSYVPDVGHDAHFPEVLPLPVISSGYTVRCHDMINGGTVVENPDLIIKRERVKKDNR